MSYEHKVLVIVDKDSGLSENSLIKLQEYFDQGWEYVDQINQPVAICGNSYSTERSTVAVVLKRKNTDLI